jgi:hypothetical protein
MTGPEVGEQDRSARWLIPSTAPLDQNTQARRPTTDWEEYPGASEVS